jgi:hypothetical protein
MSDTPITDEARKFIHGHIDKYYIEVDVACQLERELTACQARIKLSDEENETMAISLASLRARVAELEKQVNGMKQCSNCVNKENDAPCYQCRDKSLWKWKGTEPLKVKERNELRDTIDRIARHIHYPECWDVAAYPTLEDAVTEITHCDPEQCTHTKYRCADRDDGCGHCPRSEPHEHPDEQPGDDCDRMGKKVKCERVD